jgi:hypothetical protein
MMTWMGRVEGVLRGDLPADEAQSPARLLTGWLILMLACGHLYGAAMGSFSGILGDRSLQMVYSAVKVPLLLLVTFLLSLPSFFIFNTLYGLRTEFHLSLRALVASQAGVTVLLAAFAPITLVWNLSSTDQQKTVLFNALLFGLAALGGQVVLRRFYRPLLERDARHAIMLRLWGILYAFVGIQMGWILRPFVGDPNRPVEFFREDTWGNAYVILFTLLRHLLIPGG